MTQDSEFDDVVEARDPVAHPQYPQRPAGAARSFLRFSAVDEQENAVGSSEQEKRDFEALRAR